MRQITGGELCNNTGNIRKSRKRLLLEALPLPGTEVTAVVAAKHEKKQKEKKLWSVFAVESREVPRIDRTREKRELFRIAPPTVNSTFFSFV